MVCAVKNKIVCLCYLFRILWCEMIWVGDVVQIWVQPDEISAWMGKVKGTGIKEETYDFRYEITLSTFFIPTLDVL